jgi:hypothetical protein
MSSATGDPKLVRELNNFLGTELGRSPEGRSIFAWKWSEDLFWPAFRCGWKQEERVVHVPIIGTSGMAEAREIRAVPEYRRDRQMRMRDLWVVTKLLTPTQLIFGWFKLGDPDVVAKHGESQTEASTKLLLKMWNERFPGADFPNHGWRIPTDATLPRAPGDSRTPTWADTRYFVLCIKEQTRLGFQERLEHMESVEDAAANATDNRISDDVRDMIPAFLETPGQKGGTSFPTWRKLLGL